MDLFLDESGTDDVKFLRKGVSGRKVEGAVRSLMNGRILQTEIARVLYESLFVYVVLHGSETIA